MGDGNAGGGCEENCSQQSETFQSLDPINSQCSLGGLSQDHVIEVTPADVALDEPAACHADAKMAGGAFGGQSVDNDMKDASELLLALGTATTLPSSLTGKRKMTCAKSLKDLNLPSSHGDSVQPTVQEEEPSPVYHSTKKKRGPKAKPPLKEGQVQSATDYRISKLCQGTGRAPAVCDFDREVATSWGRTANGAKPSENIVQDETEDPELDKAEAELKRQYAEVGQDVEFSELQIQTSNIKVSFTFQNNEAVTIENLCAHLMKDEKIKTEHFNVRVKDKSAASNGEGRTFFGGVLTITMDVWNADENETHMHNTSVRMFGYKDSDSQKRHKAQFNGCTCKHGEILSFFDEVFGRIYKMDDVKVEPNSVFSATDNAVMDPLYGFDMVELVECLKVNELVENYKEQVTGGVNFTFRILIGTSEYKQCKPTVQKSGSIQLMLVDQPRRIRLETMRFLLLHCKSSFVQLTRLNLTKRTIDKRQKARSLLMEKRAAKLGISYAGAVTAASPPVESTDAPDAVVESLLAPALGVEAALAPVPEAASEVAAAVLEVVADLEVPMVVVVEEKNFPLAPALDAVLEQAVDPCGVKVEEKGLHVHVDNGHSHDAEGRIKG